MKFDQAQTQAIQTERNCVVSAGAGSGKTTVLANRFLYLLRKYRLKVDQILTLTFTRKAAAEMHERIYRLMLEHSDDPWIADQIGNFDKAQISTLDSFCGTIMRLRSGMFGIDPGFSVEEQDTVRLDSFCEEFIHTHKDVLKPFFLTFGIESVRDGLFKRLAGEQISLGYDHDFQKDLAGQIGIARKQRDSHLSEIHSLFAAVSELDPGKSKTILQTQEVIAGYTDTDFTNSEEQYTALTGMKFRKHAGKNDTALIYKEYATRIAELQTLLQNCVAFLASEDSLTQMMDFLDRFQKQWKEEKRRSGMISFSDVVDCSIEILKQDSGLRKYFKGKFRFIMIDEFQDNNRQQKELLYLLSERPDCCVSGIPGASDLEDSKLFFVGDEKQSIYKFRGADVSVFKGLAREMTGSHAPETESSEHLKLSNNYRSHPELIRFYNSLFSRIMGDASEMYEASFESLNAGSTDSELFTPEITLLYQPFRKDAREVSPVEGEAFALSAYLKQCVEEKKLLITTREGSRQIEYSDCALLLRSKSNQHYFEKMMRIMGIPYTSEDPRTLYLEAPFNDFYAMIQTAVMPFDRVAAAAFLRSPLCGLSDRAVTLILLHAGEILDPDCPEVEKAGFPEEEKEQYGTACSIINNLRRRIDKQPLSSLVRYFWDELGYKYYLLSVQEYHGYLDTRDYLFSLAESSDLNGESVPVFLGRLREQLGKFGKTRDVEVTAEKTEGVQILTIHKSKGLEFPLVLLAELGHKGHGRGKDLYEHTDEYGITLQIPDHRNNYFMEMAKEQVQREEAAESKRLLYVGCTRAESHLIMSGSSTQNNRNSKNKADDSVMLNMILEVMGIPRGEEETGTGELCSCRIIEPPSPGDIRGNYRREINTDLLEPLYCENNTVLIPAQRYRWSITEVMKQYNAAVDSGNSSKSEREVLPGVSVDILIADNQWESLFGDLCHWLVEQMHLNNYPGIEIPGRLKSGIDDASYRKIIPEAERLAEMFLSSRWYEDARKGGIEMEVPFYYRYNHMLISGKFDFISVSDRKALLVDFKSNKTMDMDDYLIQLYLYKQAAEELYQCEVEPYLWFLREGTPRKVDLSGVQTGILDSVLGIPGK